MKCGTQPEPEDSDRGEGQEEWGALSRGAINPPPPPPLAQNVFATEDLTLPQIYHSSRACRLVSFISHWMTRLNQIDGTADTQAKSPPGCLWEHCLALLIASVSSDRFIGAIWLGLCDAFNDQLSS